MKMYSLNDEDGEVKFHAPLILANQWALRMPEWNKSIDDVILLDVLIDFFPQKREKCMLSSAF